MIGDTVFDVAMARSAVLWSASAGRYEPDSWTPPGRHP
jgi:hypothetical protein